MDLTKQMLLKALKNLDHKLVEHQVELMAVIGGGGAMILAHGYPGSTKDVDAVVDKDFDVIKPFIEEISKEMKLEYDWFNPYFDRFTSYLPLDAKSRYEKVFTGQNLIVNSLGSEDILIMKLMAGREKDIKHIKHLLALKPNLNLIEDQLHKLQSIFPKIANEALERFYEFTDE